MKKFNTFIFFILLVLVWSLIFGLYKYYFWWIYSIIDKNINLQTISGYMALGLFLAYISGWIITKIFSKKTLLIFIWLINICCLLFLYYFWLNSIIIFNIITVFIWYFYWIWAVLKIIITWIEIKKTWFGDATVNAIVTITYIVLLITWSIIWSLISEQIWYYWIWIINFLFFLTWIFSYFIIYENENEIKNKTQEFKNQLNLFFFNNLKIIKNYFLILIPIWILWSVSTIISQKAIEYSVTNFHKSSSEATIILLYSAFWVIIGSIISIFIVKKRKYNLELNQKKTFLSENNLISKFEKNKRWYFFNFFNFLFILLIFLFQNLLNTYSSIIILAIIAGLLFWIISNLIDAFYIKKITEDNNKEYGWAFHWIAINFIVFILMFSTNAIEKNFWFYINFYFIWSLLIIVSLINIYYVYQNKID